MQVVWCLETLIFMILEISGVAGEKKKKKKKKPTPSTYTDWWCDNVSLAWVLARHTLFFVHFILFLQKRQIPVSKDKSAHKLTKYKSNITHL